VLFHTLAELHLILTGKKYIAVYLDVGTEIFQKLKDLPNGFIFNESGLKLNYFIPNPMLLWQCNSFT
jgi:hypothetical protein